MTDTTPENDTLDPTPERPRRMTARSAEDLIALAPVLLGFWPEDSVVMLTFATPRPFHARLTLPEGDSPHELHEVQERMLRPARAHGVRAAVFVVFGEHERVARSVCRRLRRASRSSDIEVVACIWADGSRYRILGGAMADGADTPVAYDVTNHPFVVEAIVEGRLSFANRAEMVASLEPDPQACAAVATAQELLGLDPARPPAGGLPEQAAIGWARRTLGEHLDAGSVPSGTDLARLVWAVQAPVVRDAAWALIERRAATAHRRLWAAILPQSPEQCVPAVAGLLGFAAWQSGDGALAWAAVDRAQRVRPGDPMATILAELLDNAVPPEAWPDGRPGSSH